MSDARATEAPPRLPSDQPSRPRSGPGRSSRVDGCLLVLLALPLLLTALQPNWIVSTLYHDPWIYFGYYLNLPNHLRTFDGFYYGTRLSVILPGYLAYQVLPPLWANHVLHLGLYYAAVGPLYLLLKMTAGRRAAFLAALVMGTNFFFLDAVGSDYTQGYGIAYFLTAAWLLAVAARSGWWRSALVAAGAAAAALVVANIVYALFVPFLAAHFLVHNRDQRSRPVVPAALFAGLGALGLVLVLGGVNYAVAGRFWFLLPSLEFTKDFGTRANPFKGNLNAWLPHAAWLVLPLLALVGGAVWTAWAWRNPKRGFSATALFYQVQLAGCFWGYLLCDFWSQSGTFLQQWFYASMLLPAVFLALGVQIAGAVEALSPRAFAVVAATAAALFVAQAVAPALTPLTVHPNYPALPVGLAAGLPALALAAWAAAASRSARRAPGRRAVALLAGCLLCLAGTQYLTRDGFRMEHSVTLMRPDFTRWIQPYDRERVDVLLAMHDGLRAVLEVEPSGTMAFWYRLNDPGGCLFDHLACTHCWRTMVNFGLGEGHEAVPVPPRPGAKLALLTQGPPPLSDIRAALARAGVEAKVIGRREIRRGGVAFTITFVRVTGWKGLAA